MLLQVLIRCCRSECDHNLWDDTSFILGVEPGPNWGWSLVQTEGGAWPKHGGEAWSKLVAEPGDGAYSNTMQTGGRAWV